MKNKSKFLTVALEAARRAEEVILQYYNDDIRATLKSDQSPVTIADTEAEKVIIDTIHKAFPDHAFLGEESGASNIQSEFTWTIDPIDGTRSYLRQVPLFGTLIALMKHDEVILGVSNLPALKECIYAEKGKGAYKGDKKLSVSKTKSLKEAFISYGSIQHFEERDLFTQLLSLIHATGRNRGFGDCWQYHLLAEGKIDIVVDPKVKIWDVAPAKIIIEEAGGILTDVTGHFPGQGAFSSLATNGILHEHVLEFFQS